MCATLTLTIVYLAWNNTAGMSGNLCSSVVKNFIFFTTETCVLHIADLSIQVIINSRNVGIQSLSFVIYFHSWRWRLNAFIVFASTARACTVQLILNRSSAKALACNRVLIPRCSLSRGGAWCWWICKKIVQVCPRRNVRSGSDCMLARASGASGSKYSKEKKVRMML